MRSILQFVTLFSITLIFAQPAIQSQRNFGGTFFDSSKCIINTADGGFIVSGTSDSNDFDILGNHGSQDVVIIKLDVFGNTQWSNTLGGSGSDLNGNIIETSDGGYLITGSTMSNDGDVSGNHGSEDGWVVRLSQDGVVLWQKTFGGSFYDQFSGGLQTNDGGFILVGSFSVDSDLPIDAWVVKISGSGDLVWQQTYGGQSGDSAQSIVKTADGNFIVAGSTNSTDGDVTFNNGGNDAWIFKIDNNSGALIWQKTIGGPLTDYSLSIVESLNGDFFLSGISFGSGGDFTGGFGMLDGWIAKINQSGDILWKHLIGGSQDDYIFAITAESDGGVLFAGDSGSNEGELSDHHGNTGVGDAWIGKLTATGETEWQKSCGGTAQDRASGLVKGSDGKYFMFANSFSFDGDLTGNYGGLDLWLVKFGPSLDNKNFKEKASLKVYPNPVKQTLYFDNPQNAKVNIAVVDLIGSKVFEQQTNGNSIDVSSLANGIYILSTSVDSNTSQIKFMKL